MTLDVITSHRLRLLAIEPEDLEGASTAERCCRIYRQFLARVPYENLSDNRVVRENPDDPENWPRATDRLLRENASCGLGGTSFSLAYALRDLLRGVGANAHCTLGYNLVTEQAHAAVVVYVEEGPLLFDPALLMSGPVPVRPGGVLADPLGEICLEPRHGPTLTVTLKMHCGHTVHEGARPLWGGAPGADDHRAIFSIIPVPAAPQNFRQAWLASFHKGRTRPLRLACRRGDVIYRYGERPGCVEILHADRREEEPVRGDRAGRLHEIFGIDEAYLAAWFASRRRG